MTYLLLKNCLTINQETGYVEKVDILLENQKISKIESSLSVDLPRSKILDLNEAYVIPGFIDCHTHLGIIEEATGKIGVDNNETSDPVTPNLRGIDAVNPQDIAFSDAVKAGITTVMTGPGSDNVVGGQSVLIKTYGKIIDQMVVKNPAGLKIALGENPITTYGADKKCPVTRMGTAGLIRELFMRTQDYLNLKENGELKERNPKYEAVIPVLKGDLPLRAHAHRADDIATAIRIAEEFKINKLVIEHGTEADLISDYLGTRNIPVAYGPMLTPRIKMELKSRSYTTVLRLVEAGVMVALISDHPYNSVDQLRTIAALLVAEGLSEIDALKCLTLNPAKILECDQRLAKIASGFNADFVVFNGHPLDLKSKVLMTLINGQIVYRKD